MELLPEDVLVDVLRWLPPRGLAVSRSVCREWRALVDARCDLRTDLLPTTLAGIFVKVLDPDEDPEFLVRPSMERRIAGSRFEYYEDEGRKYCSIPYILDCCNGLLLLEEYDQVVNPATRQWARLPPYHPASSPGSDYYFKYLAFDPTLSPPPQPHYYEVLAMQDPTDNLSSERSEWPPSVYMMGVYSSSTTEWEERPFAREEGSATTVAYFGSGHWHAAYLNRALYTYWRGDFVMRINFSNDKYKLINLPAGTNAMSRDDKVYIGKSKNRIHFALVDDDQLRLKVWFLNESADGTTEWIFKHGANLMQISHFPKHDHGTDRPWILQYGNYYHNNNNNNKEPAPAVDNGLDWNSDEDNALDIEDDMGRGKSCFRPYIDIFGFHPHKEILFLYLSNSSVVAYYFNASKIQDLGKFRIGYRCHTIAKAFIYTPCWNGELFAEN